MRKRVPEKGKGTPTNVPSEDAIHIVEENANVYPFLGCKLSKSALVGFALWVLAGLFLYYLILRRDRNPLQRGDDPMEGCQLSHCKAVGAEAFGTILGALNGVFARSNCNPSTCISMLDYFINVSVPKSSGTPLRFPEEVNEFVSYQDDHTLTLRSGMQWQCVEYARRYWMLAGKPEPAFFGGVVGAEDIWTELQDAYYLNGSTTPLLKYTNKVSDVAPKTGDLIIYPRDGPDGEFPYGHVSVVGAVEGEKVFIAEQNFHSEPWPGPYHNYSRVLTLRQDSTTGRFELYDSVHSILGWIAY